MALAYVQKAGNSADGNDQSVAVTVSSTGAGRLLVAWVKWEGANGSGVTVTDGTTAFTPGTLTNHANNDVHGQFHYLLVSNIGKTTVTANWATARTFKHVHVWEFSYTDTLSLDVQNVGSGNAATCVSGAITTTGTDEVVLGGYSEYTGAIPVSPLINAVAAAQSVIDVPGGSFTASWERVLTATFTGGIAQIGTNAGNQDYIVNIISFKAEAGGGGGTVIPVLMNYYRQQKN